jgi:hypothetical protein
MTITRNFSVLANGAGSANNLSLGGATLGTNALAVTGTTLLNSALTYGGVTLSNAVTGTGSMALSANPRFTSNLEVTDANYYLTVASSTPYLNFDSNDYISYSRSSNTMNFAIGGSTIATMTSTGLAVTGALSKGSGSFRIEHPLPALTETHQLVHSFIEGPKADLIYRGKAELVAGAASVNIDTVSTMTESTFVLLCRDVQCFTTNESDWTPVKGSVSGNILTIVAQDDTSTATISWMVIGERQDKHIMETEWTDEDGHVIVEPLKPVDAVVTAENKDISLETK